MLQPPDCNHWHSCCSFFHPAPSTRSSYGRTCRWLGGGLDTVQHYTAVTSSVICQDTSSGWSGFYAFRANDWFCSNDLIISFSVCVCLSISEGYRKWFHREGADWGVKKKGEKVKWSLNNSRWERKASPAERNEEESRQDVCGRDRLQESCLFSVRSKLVKSETTEVHTAKTETKTGPETCLKWR